MAGQPPRLLLRAGKSSVKSCVRAGHMTEAGLTEDAQATYDRLAYETTWPDQRANRLYLAVMVLPLAALYKTLRERGRSEQDAIEAVETAFLATGGFERGFFNLILSTRLGRRLFLLSLRPNWLWMTPPPANQWTVTERTPTKVTIEVTRCYRWDTFNLVGTPEVASAACAFEEYTMSGSPALRLETNSMAAGAERCRFCFEVVGQSEEGEVGAEPTPRGVSSRQTQRLVGKFDRSLRRTDSLLVDKFGEEQAAVMRPEVLGEFRSLIPEIPYVGGWRNPYSEIIRGVARGLAMHRVVLQHGGRVQDTGELIHQRNRAKMERIPRVIRHRLLRNLFIRQHERAARRSQARRYPGDWVMELVEGDGESFDHGMDVTECGALKFLQKHGAEELLPYICDVDYVMAEAMGYELRRTKTLAWGCDRCDFRISMDGVTSAAWPPEFAEQTCGQPQAEEETSVS